MKKKIQKPLKLSRETLTSLDPDNLRQPVGAASMLPNGCATMGCTTDATASTCAWKNTNCVGW